MELGYRHGFAITPNDSADLGTPTQAIWVGGTGDLTVLLENDTVAVQFVNIPDGTLLQIRAVRVYDTGTDATNLVGLY